MKRTYRKHRIKKFVALLMAFVMLIGAVPCIGVTAFAASSSEVANAVRANLPIVTRACPTSGASKVRPYASETSSTVLTNRYIDTFKDNIVVTGINASGTRVRVKYPSGNSFAEFWFATDDILGINSVQIVKYSAGSKYDCYRLSSSNGVTGGGSIASKDSVTVLGKRTVGGVTYYVSIYPVSNQTVNRVGGITHKIALCKYCPSNSNSGNNNMVDVTRNFAGKYITLKSVQNGRYLCADGSVANTPAMCNRTYANTSSTSWEMFKVTVTNDGYAGFKAYNGKWLATRMDKGNNPIETNTNNLLEWESYKIYQKGSDYFIRSKASNKWLCVRVDMNNAPVQACGAAPSTWERFAITVVNPAPTVSNNESAVRSRLDSIANGSLKYDKNTVMSVGNKFTGTRSGEQCKGYAKNAFYLCFKITPGSTQSKESGRNYLINNTNGMKQIGAVTGMTNNETSRNAIKNLFRSARPGDFVQIRRQHTGSHSAIVYSVTDTNVTFLEANTDGRGTIMKNTYTWEALCKKDMAIAVYTATDYRLK